MTGERLPTVSVILAVLDEAEHIEEVLATLSDQDYPGLIEILVADGGSSDGTVGIVVGWAGRDRRIRLVENPRRRQSHGLNAAAADARGEFLVRADGHTVYDPDYVRRSVEVALETGGAAGGPMNPVGTTAFEETVAAVMKTRWLMPARFHHAVTREEVDTVYLGAFRRDDFVAVGGFRDFPSGAGEDPDFYDRWRRSGRPVHVDPQIRSRYRPRGAFSALWPQYLRYGRAKAEMLLTNGRLPSLRFLAPPLLVVALPASLVAAAVLTSFLPILGVAGTWAVFLALVALVRRRGPLFVAVAATMQIAYGVGVIAGLTRPGAVSSLRTPVSAG